MKPWHLYSEAERQCVIAVLDSMGTEGNLLDASCPSAYRAAANVLRDAAPWPDEALVAMFSGGYVVEIVGTGAHLTWFFKVLDDKGRSFWTYSDRLEPLTPSAAEFLAAMGGRRR